MKFCSNCQRNSNDDELYCVRCGTALIDKVEVEEEVLIKPELESLEIIEPEIIEPEKIEPEIIEPKYIKPPHTVSIRETPVVVESTDIVKKIALIALAVFLAPVGLVVGLVMMSDKEKYKKEFGQILIIISVTVFIAVTLCCCVLGTFGILMYN